MPLLCQLGFTIHGLHQLQITTLADNHPMIAAAAAGFALEGITATPPGSTAPPLTS